MKQRLLLVVCVCAIVGLSSWGFLMHRTINQLVIYELPKSMQPFFYKNMDYIVKQSVRPDERRNTDSLEASKHFIDFEAFGDSAAWKMPYDWNEAVTKYSKDTLLEYGYVPYVIITMKVRLTDAFRQKNTDSILFYAADMGHYIGDAHVPLHTTINYDGQMTGQKGLHSLWESTVPALDFNTYNLSSKHKAKYLKDPAQAVWESLRLTHQLVPDVLRLETETSKDFVDSTKYRVQIRRGRESKSYSTDFARAYSKRLGPTVNQQAIRSANMFADFLYTCWVDAGKPDLNALLSSSMTAQDRKTLKQQNKWFKKNTLIENKTLLSRQETNQTSE